VVTTGDGMLAVFDGAERAVRGAAAMTRALDEIGLPIRVGVHTGEIEYVPGTLRGVTVHVAARITALAGPGEVLVSDTTRGLIESSELTFTNRGVHTLKGVARERTLYAAG
jgi:class 3 adenylate cyclase